MNPDGESNPNCHAGIVVRPCSQFIGRAVTAQNHIVVEGMVLLSQVKSRT